MRTVVWLSVIAALSMLTGCTSLHSLSDIKADGAIQRSVTVKMTNNGMSDKKPDPKKLLAFSTAAGWKTTLKEVKDEIFFEASRTLAPGESASGKMMVVGSKEEQAEVEIQLKKQGDGALDYTETWTWKGAKTPDNGPTIDEVGALLKAALVDINPTPEQTLRIARGLSRSLWRKIFGPGDPIIGEMLAHQESGIRKLTLAGAEALDLQIKAEFPSVDEAKRRAAVRRFVKGLGDKTTEETKPDPNEAAPKQDESPLLAIMASVGGPGEITFHNGRYDMVENQVFWSMYLQACAFEPVVLRATFKP